MIRFRFALMFVALVALAADAARAAIVLQPDESASADVFVYQGTPATNQDSGGFAGSLGTSNTGGGGHDTETLIRFDSLPALTGAQVASAKLFLYSVFNPFPGATTPSAGSTISVSAFAPDSAWAESAVTWNTPRPGVNGVYNGGAAVASTLFNNSNAWFSFDLTSITKDWLDGNLTNNGVLLKVLTPSFTAPFFPSSASSNASLRPYLEITEVPEPASAALLALGGLLALRRRRHA